MSQPLWMLLACSALVALAASASVVRFWIARLADSRSVGKAAGEGGTKRTPAGALEARAPSSALARPDPRSGASQEDLDTLLWAATGRLSQRIAHEVNNSLASVLGHAEIGLISREPERLMRSLEMSAKAGEELRLMLQSLSDLSQAARARAMSRESLVAAIRPVLSLLRKSCEKASLDIETHFEELPSVVCDRRAVGCAVAALMLVLIDELRVGEGGKLTIDLGMDGEQIRVLLRSNPPRPVTPPSLAGGDGTSRFEERLAALVAAVHGGVFQARRSASGTEFSLSLSADRPGREAGDDRETRKEHPSGIAVEASRETALV